MHKSKMIPMVLSSFFLALAIVLPFITGQLQQLGSMLLPMHLPIMLCGFICGSRYGLVVGMIAPLLRSSLFSMPVFYPNALAMAIELATYGFCCGFFFEQSKWKCIRRVYVSLFSAMILGRISWGLAMSVFMFGSFTWQIFMIQAFLQAIPGILLQLVFIPAIMLVLHKTHLMPSMQKNAIHPCDMR